MKWLPYELHSHTFHSDARHSLVEMARQARLYGLHGLALTDHNTMTGLMEAPEVQQETGMHIIHGMEWTTFYGHMLTLGIHEYVDWRQLGLTDIHKGIEGVKRQNGVVGIAHPYTLGSPMCTGCYWDYTIQDWNDINYIEVWSGLLPSIRNRNIRAFQLWTDLLNQGYRIGATSGRDWHDCDPITEPICATFLGIDDSGSRDLSEEERCIEAIRNGAMSVSMGPLIQVFAQLNGQRYGIGSEVNVNASESSVQIDVSLDMNVREGQWYVPEQILRIKLMSNLGEVGEIKLVNGQTEGSVTMNVQNLTWLRAELYGVFHELHTMIGFTNPIYFKAL